MKKRKILAFLTFLSIFLSFYLYAQKEQASEQKVVQAIRANNSITIDGVLDEDVWKQKGYSDFIMSDPTDGAQPTEKTEVWIAYDDTNLYVAARLYDSNPELITSRLGRRDDFVESDWFIFAVDPYYDRRTGYQFAVNPAGSIVDWTLYNDEWDDDTWDGVWASKALINQEGWAVEIRIPYNQLRFPKKDEYIWGVNFKRVIKRKNERVGFVWVPKEDSGYVSRFARLEGIRNIHPGRHVEILPYTVGQAHYSPSIDGNPFRTGKEYLGNAGFDLKWGIKSNLTLDTTINPDFGQVEVDPAVINLSAFETFYTERRPFFIEGANIFNAFGTGGATSQASISWPMPSFFYSRRIGRSPQGFVTYDGYVNFPDRSTILGAAKLTGKLGGVWNVGFLSVLTAREYAEIDHTGERLREEVEPFSYYGVLRSQREFNEGKQGVGFMATSVVRDLNNDTLGMILNKNAFSLGIDGWTFLDNNRTWVASGWFGATHVEGSQESIYRLQNSSLHYFQRPDATHVEVNEEATSLSGWGGRLIVNKQKGQFLFNAAIGSLSPGFDPNDIGFQYASSDIINMHLLIGYNWPHPGKVFRNWYIFGGPFRNYDFGGNKFWDGYLLIVEGQLLNYWGINTMLAYNPETVSKTLTRGGPLALIPWGYQVDFEITTDSRKAVVISAKESLYSRPSEGYQWEGSLSFRIKPSSNISFSFGPGYSARRSDIQWVTNVEDPWMTETFGTRYVFGQIFQRMLFGEIRLNWIFTPRLSLQLYLQPFLAVGKYDNFRELARPKSFEYNIYGVGESSITYDNGIYTVDPDGLGLSEPFTFYNPDFNLKSLRGTIVLRWEYLSGSTLYLVWTQNRADYAYPGDLALGRDLKALLTAPGDNVFLVKISYRWNI
ncbi:MAG: carbohydrate binding family 9 domain-containing protein [Candidatus Aminicenantes bacterium]|nr:carbohydrate binding family 9 domain-containing protein [Candidatus Aminicenantes bacterium]MDH5386143.1 carbohydrate binding family 9 domain-containing protein [Candidatus Aminicenantes bacterium]